MQIKSKRDSVRGLVATRPVGITTDGLTLTGDLAVPTGSPGVVLFAHGSGSSRLSPRNQQVARTLQAAGIGTLLFDLLSSDEERAGGVDGRLRFDIELLATRLIDAVNFIRDQPETKHLGIGCFGASTGGAAALVAAATLGSRIQTIVSRGGRPDLAGRHLLRVETPTLLIVGERDEWVVQLNLDAYRQLRCKKRITLIPGATHLFTEPGALERVAAIAVEWFEQHLHADIESRPDSSSST